jgi:hypothetical protein
MYVYTHTHTHSHIIIYIAHDVRLCVYCLSCSNINISTYLLVNSYTTGTKSECAKYVRIICMVSPCILESSINYLSPTNALILTLFNLKY